MVEQVDLTFALKRAKYEIQDKLEEIHQTFSGENRAFFDSSQTIVELDGEYIRIELRYNVEREDWTLVY